MSQFDVQGIPEDLPEEMRKVWRSRFDTAASNCVKETGRTIEITVSSRETKTDAAKVFTKGRADIDLSPQERALRYKSTPPLFDFNQLVVPKAVVEDLLLAVDLIQLESKVFDEWGLREIEPFPRTALNLHGAPGTGKTLAAHALASKIQRPILVASYAQIESMYHGEGPKNVEAIFLAAERDNALLFIDEADSLLSKRLTNVTQGSEQAINSMRSQLLICLERFRGIVIFSTNLVKNYDRAFETRVRHIHFPLPDEIGRRTIWEKHLVKKILRSTEVNIEQLAKIEDVCGRDIKNAIIDAALRVAREGREQVTFEDLRNSIEKIKAIRIDYSSSNEINSPIDSVTQQKIQGKVKEFIANQNNHAHTVNPSENQPVFPYSQNHLSLKYC